MHKVDLEVQSGNPRAIRMYEKLGFVREGVRREHVLLQGEWRDIITVRKPMGEPLLLV